MNGLQWVLACTPQRGTITRKELTALCHLEGIAEASIGNHLLKLVDRGLLVKIAPGLYRRPTNHEANP